MMARGEGRGAGGEGRGAPSGRAREACLLLERCLIGPHNAVARTLSDHEAARARIDALLARPVQSRRSFLRSMLQCIAAFLCRQLHWCISLPPFANECMRWWRFVRVCSGSMPAMSARSVGQVAPHPRSDPIDLLTCFDQFEIGALIFCGFDSVGAASGLGLHRSSSEPASPPSLERYWPPISSARVPSPLLRPLPRPTDSVMGLNRSASTVCLSAR